MRIPWKRKFYLAVIILITALGSVLFFPMNIGGRYTCFYHRIFNASHPVFGASVSAHTHHRVENSPGSDDNHNNGQENMSPSDHDSSLLDAYLNFYAFIWWGSVGLLALFIYLFFKLKRNVKVKESSLTIK